MATRLVIADAPELNRRALTALVSSEPDCRVVGEGGTVDEAIAACEAAPHDVLLLDSRLPGTEPGPGSCVPRILDRCPDSRILVLVADAGQRCAAGSPAGLGPAALPCCAPADCVGHHLVAGASCILRRDARPPDLFRAIRRVARGRVCFGAPLMTRVLECVTHHRGIAARGLSARERQVAALVARGCCNKEIAAELEVGVPAIKKHVSHILAKLGIHDRLQLGLLVSRNPELAEPWAPRLPGTAPHGTLSDGPST